MHDTLGIAVKFAKELVLSFSISVTPFRGMGVYGSA